MENQEQPTREGNKVGTETKTVKETQTKNPVVKKKNKMTKVSPPNQKIIIVLVRGLIRVRGTIKDTLKMLRLTRKNHCAVVDNTPINMGMIKKAKDYITWGEIDPETYTELISKRGEQYEGPETCSKGKIKYNKFFVHEGKKYKKYFRLNPPRKGFGRKGIKIPFKVGGGLGYRGEKINQLIKNML